MSDTYQPWWFRGLDFITSSSFLWIMRILDRFTCSFVLTGSTSSSMRILESSYCKIVGIENSSKLRGCLQWKMSDSSASALCSESSHKQRTLLLFRVHRHAIRTLVDGGVEVIETALVRITHRLFGHCQTINLLPLGLTMAVYLTAAAFDMMAVQPSPLCCAGNCLLLSTESSLHFRPGRRD